MGSETMDIEQLAVYLKRDARELTKLADRGQLPGRKVGGAWRFAQAEINHWMEGQLRGCTDEQLKALDEAREDGVPILPGLIPEACVAVPLAARTRSSLLRELVRLAEESWLVYDPDAVLDAINSREEMGSTAQEGGVAVPHARRPLPGAVGESLVAFGRTASGIPFGGTNRTLTDMFFLVLCTDADEHLKVLARLARLFRRPGFLDELRAAETPAAARNHLIRAERELLGLPEAAEDEV